MNSISAKAKLLPFMGKFLESIINLKKQEHIISRIDLMTTKLPEALKYKDVVVSIG